MNVRADVEGNVRRGRPQIKWRKEVNWLLMKRALSVSVGNGKIKGACVSIKPVQ